MDANNSPVILFFLGIVGIFLSFLFDGWFWGSLIYVGFSWIISAIILKASERELTGGAFGLTFLFGIIGAVIWIVIDISRESHGYRSGRQYYMQIEKEDFKCGNCMWFSKGCPRKETLINAEPCTQFSFKS